MKTNCVRAKWTAVVVVLAAVIAGMSVTAAEVRLTGIDAKNSGVMVRGVGVAGAEYNLYWTTNLTAWNQAVNVGETTGAVASNGTFEVLDQKNYGPGFYRVEKKKAGPASASYLVVDMSGEKGPAKWPVTELEDIPDGGWPDEFKIAKLVLRRIPAGTFMLGSPTNELGRARYEQETQHAVTISKPFYLGVFEVTQKQWELVMESNPAYYKGDMRPVEGVTYDAIRGREAGNSWPGSREVDEKSFLGILREMTGLEFDLPTEAQWEYACRAGTATALNSGKDLSREDVCPNLAEVGRYLGNQDRYGNTGDGKGGYSKYHTTVGCYLPNAWGLYDMHGNVWEWCLDWFEDFTTDAVTDPVGPDETYVGHVTRGGSCEYYAKRCRSASRDHNGRATSSYDMGFRLALPAP